jgi:hypothetical protein
MKKCIRKLLCRYRDPYAEVFSQAYSISYADDNYLAKQKQVPSSMSNLSSDVSFQSAESQDEFSQLVTSVDLLQIGTEYEEKQRSKKEQNSQKPLDFMAMRTVTSIEGKDTGECDIETLLESDESSEEKNAREQPEEGEFKLDPMDYHEVSKICAKSKRRLVPKSKVPTFMRMKRSVMKAKHFDMIHEDSGAEDFSDEHSESSVGGIPVSIPPVTQADFTPRVMIRNISSTSTPYLEGNSTQSFVSME